ncbi:hypothetical protein [Brevibacillus migulae]|uniref:hypothetical protein n=1 Tax=Brevibacillus migulae TaxID=1644114 RepID=UPI00106DDA93|nr:hypothetical protein [Brevibacillus migulae]
MGDNRRHRLKWIFMVLLIATILSAGGVYAARGSEAETTPQGELEWARAQGFLAEGVNGEKPIKQAEFLKMVMTVYDAKKPGVFVPAGAENHWAAGYYATAKQEGVIDCGCQIKPNITLTVGEAAKFVVNAIHLKSGNVAMQIADVYEWLPDPKDMESSLTNEQAVILVKKMSEVFVEKGLSIKKRE